MKKGILIIAHNNRDVDYAKMAIISGSLAKKSLSLPVSLITDVSTIEWMKESGTYDSAMLIFENIIETQRPQIDNYRKLHDGDNVNNVPFINANRSSAYDLTPYDHTLLIDSDFLIFTDILNNFWDIDDSVLLGESFSDIEGSRVGFLDKWTSETGVHLYWATTVMFKKDNYSKIFFNLVSFIKENYEYYSNLFRFDPRQYRNDISFSIAKHILDGFEKSGPSLPPILTIQDKDVLLDFDNNLITVLVKEISGNEGFILGSVKDQDIHLMNKQSMLRLFDNFKGLT